MTKSFIKLAFVLLLFGAISYWLRSFVQPLTAFIFLAASWLIFKFAQAVGYQMKIRELHEQNILAARDIIELGQHEGEAFREEQRYLGGRIRERHKEMQELESRKW